MAEREWLVSDNPIAMLVTLQTHWRGKEDDLVRVIHRYLLVCCRAIWKLLPMEASRGGVEVAERYIEGRASREEYGRAEYDAEGAAFFLEDYEHWSKDDEDAAERERWVQYRAEREARIGVLVKGVEAIPPEELRRLVRLSSGDATVTPRRLLEDAAYFADAAIAYPGIRPRESVIQRYPQFLSAQVLREVVGNPFRLPPDSAS